MTRRVMELGAFRPFPENSTTPISQARKSSLGEPTPDREDIQPPLRSGRFAFRRRRWFAI